ncbi:hypothetical protein GCM10010505_28430 [Kitasatospora aburaviensis]
MTGGAPSQRSGQPGAAPAQGRPDRAEPTRADQTGHSGKWHAAWWSAPGAGPVSAGASFSQRPLDPASSPA